MNITQEGLMTVFHAECVMQDGIVRLNAYGEGKCAYLGVMIPENGKLVLRKRLSREALRVFPQHIEYAAERELAKVQRPEPKEKAADELLWFETANGFLTAFDGAQSFIAIPSELKNSPITRTIGGKEYMIFPGKRKV